MPLPVTSRSVLRGEPFCPELSVGAVDRYVPPWPRTAVQRNGLGVCNTPLRATGYCERTQVAILLVAPREELLGWEHEERIELGDHALAQRQGSCAVVAVGAAGWLRNNAVDDAALEQLLGRDAHRGRRLR